MKTAIVHDYLNQAGGAERVVAALHRMFPGAPIFTTILDRQALWPELRGADIRVSWMQRLPGVREHFRAFLPLYPLAVESFRLDDFDVILSSSSGFALGARGRPGAVHLCYCHTPARFLWDYEWYVRRQALGSVARALLPPLVGLLRRWDRCAASRPTAFIANSTATAQRIRRVYGRPSTIVFPPVDLARFSAADSDEESYLVVARLVPYKRVDLAVQAFNASGRPLLVVGDGPDLPVLRKMAGPNVRFLGRVDDAALAGLYARCRALIVPGREDFGIAPVEANASGRPVIAFRAGGALDTVDEGRTGVFFHRQDPTDLNLAVTASEAISWSKPALRAHAEQFGEPAFRARFLEVLQRTRVGRAASHPSDPRPPESQGVTTAS